MILSRKWLNEFVDLGSVGDRDFAEAMTLSGSKVEVTEVLNDYRIKKACERLTTNNAKYAQLTIAAIGQSVGYKSQTTFVKQFRKCTGLTPSVYQKFVAEDRRNKETGA